MSPSQAALRGRAQDEGTQASASPIVEGDGRKGRSGRESTAAASGGPYGLKEVAVSPGETSAGSALARLFITT